MYTYYKYLLFASINVRIIINRFTYIPTNILEEQITLIQNEMCSN